MRAPEATSWGCNRDGSLAVCVMLIAMLVLSSVSVDVFVRHAHDDNQIHTHVSRTLSTRAVHEHGDSEHRHPPAGPLSDDGQDECPANPESESTLVVSSLGNVIRQNRDMAKRMLDIPPVAIPTHAICLELICHFRSDHTSGGNERPVSAQVLRSTVLLI